MDRVLGIVKAGARLSEHEGVEIFPGGEGEESREIGRCRVGDGRALVHLTNQAALG